jgi:Fe-S cluster biogenesis protein NfuA/nitrite reductase/ring-hydroxylating ferredoxin subunit
MMPTDTVTGGAVPGDLRPTQNSGQVGALLKPGGSEGAAASGSAEDLVRQVSDLYGSALRHILEILHDLGKLDDVTLEALAADDLVSSLLVFHGLHPRSLELRVITALDRLRPYLGSQGGEAELEGISPEGVVRLKLFSTHEGFRSSPAALRSAVEEAIGAAAPEVTAIDVAVEDKPDGSPGLIPLDALLVRENSPAAATPATSWHDFPDGIWEPVPEIAGLVSGEVAGFLVGRYPMVACRIAQDIYAYRDYCPRCTGSMAGATLQRPVTEAADGSLLTCPTCRGHFDVRHAGTCLEDKDLQLDPLPLLVQGGVLSVAVPRESVQAPPLLPAPAPPTPAEVTPVRAIPLVTPEENAVPSALTPGTE